MNTIATIRSTDSYRNMIDTLANLQKEINHALSLETDHGYDRADRIATRRDHMVEGAALALGIPGLYINEDLTNAIVANQDHPEA